SAFSPRGPALPQRRCELPRRARRAARAVPGAAGHRADTGAAGAEPGDRLQGARRRVERSGAGTLTLSSAVQQLAVLAPEAAPVRETELALAERNVAARADLLRVREPVFLQHIRLLPFEEVEPVLARLSDQL